jgi:hypothetical protein
MHAWRQTEALFFRAMPKKLAVSLCCPALIVPPRLAASAAPKKKILFFIKSSRSRKPAATIGCR